MLPGDDRDGGRGDLTSGAIALLVALSTRRRPDLLARDHVLHVEAPGIRCTAPEATAVTTWQDHRQIREMRGDFLLVSRLSGMKLVVG